MKLRWPYLSSRRCRWSLRLIGIGLLLLSAGGVLGVHKLGDALLHPKRRSPGDWQRAVLDRPAHHGVVIERFSTFAEDGVGIQALLVRPAVRPGGSTRYREMQRRLGVPAPAAVGESESRVASATNGKTAETCAAVRATVVLLHGRSGIKEDGVTIAERFAAAGLATVLFDSRGHGESPASFMTYGKREVEDLSTVIDVLQARYHKTGDAGSVPLLVFGNSMGAAVALQALPRETRLRAAVLVSPFADLPELTRGMLRRRLPRGTAAGAGSLQLAVSAYAQVRAGFTLGDIRPERDAAAIQVPTMVVHGDCDGVIPVSHGQRVFAAIAGERKVWRPVVGGQHSNVLMHGGDDLYEEVIRFFLKAADEELEQRAFRMASGG